MAKCDASRRLELDSKSELLYVQPSPGVYKGYKKELLIKELSPASKSSFLCFKCDNIAKNAILVKEKLACSTCVSEYKTKQTDIEVRDRVSKLVLHCPLKERGCGWAGELGWVNRHMERCLHLRVRCPMGCEDTFLRGQVEDHVKKCSNKRVTCQYCNEQHISHKVPQHLLTCPGYPVKCIQGCKKEVARNEMEMHVSTECDESKVMCAYSRHGCKKKATKRSEVLAHIRDASDEHADLMRCAIERMDEVIDVQLKRLSKSCEDVRRQFELHNADCKDYNVASRQVMEWDSKLEEYQKNNKAIIRELKEEQERGRREMNETIQQLNNDIDNAYRHMHYDRHEYVAMIDSILFELQELKTSSQQKQQQIKTPTSKNKDFMLYFSVFAALIAFVICMCIIF